MNKLTLAKRVHILRCLVEGNSIRSTCRITGAAKNTVVKLLKDVGEACLSYQDKVMRDLPCLRIQVDEIWCFCSMKEGRVPEERKGQLGYGDVYTWVAIDPDTKLVPCFLVGRRDTEYAIEFMTGLASRLQNRVQLTSDGHNPYLWAVEAAFASKIDYAMMKKEYGGIRVSQDGTMKKCRASECSSINRETICGDPDSRHISTSLVERQNLTMRMGMRRFTRKTNAFSKKLWNLYCAVALHFMYYNFARIHQTLRVTPAMEAGISDHVWTLGEIAGLAPIEAPKKRGPYKNGA